MQSRARKLEIFSQLPGQTEVWGPTPPWLLLASLTWLWVVEELELELSCNNYSVYGPAGLFCSSCSNSDSSWHPLTSSAWTGATAINNHWLNFPGLSLVQRTDGKQGGLCCDWLTVSSKHHHIMTLGLCWKQQPGCCSKRLQAGPDM